MSLGYLLRRVGMFLLVVWVAASINFVIPRMARGDPIQAQFAQLETLGIRNLGHGPGSSRVQEAARPGPPHGRAVLLLSVERGAISTSDPRSRISPADIGRLIVQRLPWTIGLLTASTIIAFIVGNLLGALLGWPGSSRWVKWLVPILMPLSAIPYYLLGLILIFTFAFGLKLFPLGSAYSTGAKIELAPDFAFDVLYHSILPALSIVLSVTGFWMLGMRGMMVTNMGEGLHDHGRGQGSVASADIPALRHA